ncbi:uncharacterized protein LOC111448154 isoform X1 [Cucurbita moschata]|uniref:Uncharacterized protein LOC111448154 isoform X1 n=1 Tax=Cucurbita moschata TaxID=3662 RepID=A0A6J1FSV1_CUCMO|nr:uncharacterized protein LOC111448154 isoform X1 [Cucurbita moschata]
MARRMELGFPKSASYSLREQAARTILRNVRSQGHSYVELREDGKRFIFFCTLCLAPCYSDSVLFNHLKGTLHTERLSAAKLTLLGPNPWPFDDGVLFFHKPVEGDNQVRSLNDNQERLLEYHNNDNNLAIVSYVDHSKGNGNGHGEFNGNVRNVEDCSFENLDDSGDNGPLVIPGVLIKDEISDIRVRELGYGQIAARFTEKDGILCGISRIWCEWLGKVNAGLENKVKVPVHDFAIVTFTYNVDLGRKGLLDDVKLLLSSSTGAEPETDENSRVKRKKCFSDSEDVSQSMSHQYDSSGEDSSASNCVMSSLLLDRYDDRILNTTVMLNKSVKRELKRQQRLASERMCDICQQKILTHKDVATLLNMKTGRLACSSRNVNGVFHVFHTSCLIHWILLCEYEMSVKNLGGSKVRRRYRRKNKTKGNKYSKNGETRQIKTQIDSVFCPACQGTGIIVDGDDLEKPTIPLSEIFKYKIKVSDARRAWMKSPEVLQNCSTGFHFPYQSEETLQENMKHLKLVHFYGAFV